MPTRNSLMAFTCTNLHLMVTKGAVFYSEDENPDSAIAGPRSVIRGNIDQDYVVSTPDEGSQTTSPS